MNMKNVRLDKFLADAGAGTRSEVKEMIRKGRVTVDGKVAKDSGMKVSVSENLVELDAVQVCSTPEFVYYLLNKPAGYVSATEDGRDPTVLELLPDRAKGLFPVGRLDKDTVGLLLITNDGQLAHRLLSPARHVDKTYYVETADPVTPEMVQMLREGVDIGDDKKTLAAVVKDADDTSLLLTIREGRYHQVKRMMEAVGTHVTYLKRLSMGILQLSPDLQEGCCQELTEEQVMMLKKSVGL